MAIPPSCAEPLLNDTAISWEEVLAEETAYIEARRRACNVDDKNSPRFSVAFSGGGVRAAAFQAGVLWRLAECDLLKDVDHFIGVSGGGYITSAFASHLLQEGSPQEGESLSAWYRRLVARTLVRFQHNVGYLVRDPFVKGGNASFVGSGWMPRSCDCLLLTLVTVYTVLIQPFTFTFMTVVPLVEGVQLFFGLAMRHSFCSIHEKSARNIFMLLAPERSSRDAFGPVPFWNIARGLLLGGNYSPWNFCWSCVGVGMFATFFLWCAKHVLGRKKGSAYLFMYSLLAALVRLICISVVILALVELVMVIQLLQWNLSEPLRHAKGMLCTQWLSGIPNAGGNISSSAADIVYNECADVFSKSPWHSSHVQILERVHVDVGLTQKRVSQGIVWIVLSIWFVGIGIATFLAPFFPKLFRLALYSGGPLGATLLSGMLMQFRVFGALTGQCICASRHCCAFNYDYWKFIVGMSYILILIVFPFYQNIHRPMHSYYVKSLRAAFFDQGEDCTMGSMKDNVYCPLFMHTATSNDFRRPGDTSLISEVSMSPLHMGGETTGYVRTPSHQKLAKTVALGAAATDAQVLGKWDTVNARVMMQALNLRMGDYILFNVASGSRIEMVARRWLPCPKRNQRLSWNCASVLPTVTFNMLGYLLMFLAHLYVSPADPGCGHAKMLFLAGVAIISFLFCLSFFSSGCPSMSMWPSARAMHIATRFCHEQDGRPVMLYLTDGGLQDCTGLVQLLRRRCKQILLVIAFEDPHDELNQLRDAMHIANKCRLASFFDPDVPSRDIRVNFHHLRDFQGTFLRVGIRYGWELEEGDIGYGEILIVKNRLPMEIPKWFNKRMPAFVTEQEVMGGRTVQAEDAWQNMEQTDLAGCCCNCCHFNVCNIGPKFPHISTGVQCLTPQHFNTLCRLGYQVSTEAINIIGRSV